MQHNRSGQYLDWVICGGESGPKARPMNHDWVRSLRDQCKAANVPFMLKQWGEWVPFRRKWTPIKGGWKYKETMAKVGKKVAGRLLDGELWDQYPTQKMECCK